MIRDLKIEKSFTVRNSESLNIYLTEISKYPVLNPEEEFELSMKAFNGDEKAKEKLVCCNLRFVVSVAKKYQQKENNLSDLINEGNIGLMTAADKFDPTKGFKFISYAVWWIRQSIMAALYEKGRMIRIPLNKVGVLAKINAKINEFEQQNQRKPSVEELSELIDTDDEKIIEVLASQGKTSSLDAPIMDGEDSRVGDMIANENAPSADESLVYESLKSDVNLLLSSLSPKEQTVIRMTYGIGGQETTLGETADILGISRERARQIRECALRRLRNNSRCSQIRQYL